MSYRVDYHPLVKRDLSEISRWMADYAGKETAREKLREISATILMMRSVPHIGTLRHEIASGLRAIPSAKKAVIAFTVDDSSRTVRIICITYGGADWARRSRARLR